MREIFLTVQRGAVAQTLFPQITPRIKAHMQARLVPLGIKVRKGTLHAPWGEIAFFQPALKLPGSKPRMDAQFEHLGLAQSGQ